jgi:hypothetical protein
LIWGCSGGRRKAQSARAFSWREPAYALVLQ